MKIVLPLQRELNFQDLVCFQNAFFMTFLGNLFCIRFLKDFGSILAPIWKPFGMLFWFSGVPEGPCLSQEPPSRHQRDPSGAPNALKWPPRAPTGSRREPKMFQIGPKAGQKAGN